MLFFSKKEIAEFVLFKKLYKLFELDNLHLCTKNEIMRLNRISAKVSVEFICKVHNLTKYNVDKILLYLRDKDKFTNKQIPIAWGPGNHGNIEQNIHMHYMKHVLSDEYHHWKRILPEVNVESYAKYAIDSFYEMRDVVVHSNGTKVYLSGFYANVFIIGRYENDTFGISSCYYVESGEKSGRYRDMCFKLDFNN